MQEEIKLACNVEQLRLRAKRRLLALVAEAQQIEANEEAR